MTLALPLQDTAPGRTIGYYIHFGNRGPDAVSDVTVKSAVNVRAGHNP